MMATTAFVVLGVETMRNAPGDLKHWRDRAEEARAIAETINDPEARGLMLDVAASYDRMAERAGEASDLPRTAKG